MVIAEIFDALFGWTLYFGELYGLIIISFILTLLSTLAYKFLTDQKALKALKEETKEINKKIRENKSNPEKLSQLQSQAMQKSFEQMKHSFRPILFTFSDGRLARVLPNASNMIQFASINPMVNSFP